MLGAGEIEVINECLPEQATLEHVAVLHVLCAHRNRESGLCNPSKETLAKALRVSERTMYKLLAELREMGVISWKAGGKKAGGGHCSNSYILEIFEQAAKEKAEQQSVLQYFEAMRVCYEDELSEQEKQALNEWEKKRPRAVGTSDWPGWEKHIGVCPRNHAKMLLDLQGYITAMSWYLDELSEEEKQDLSAWEATGKLSREWPGWVKWIGPPPVEGSGLATRQTCLPCRSEGATDTAPTRQIEPLPTRQIDETATRQIDSDATRQIQADATRQTYLPSKPLEAEPRSKNHEAGEAHLALTAFATAPSLREEPAQVPEPVPIGHVVGLVLDISPGGLCQVQDERGMDAYLCPDPALQGILRAAYQNRANVAFTYELRQRNKRTIAVITEIEESHGRTAGTISSTAATA